jgi:hypothetical protein
LRPNSPADAGDALAKAIAKAIPKPTDFLLIVKPHVVGTSLPSSPICDLVDRPNPR